MQAPISEGGQKHSTVFNCQHQPKPCTSKLVNLVPQSSAFQNKLICIAPLDCVGSFILAIASPTAPVEEDDLAATNARRFYGDKLVFYDSTEGVAGEIQIAKGGC
jgi:hypothetical protein